MPWARRATWLLDDAPLTVSSLFSFEAGHQRIRRASVVAKPALEATTSSLFIAARAEMAPKREKPASLSRFAACVRGPTG